MTIIQSPVIPQFSDKYFTLSIRELKTRVRMEMFVGRDMVNTQNLPCVVSELQKRIPEIFTTKCFNYKNQPFIEEVKNTELGHLFEHILLEKFCTNKAAFGYSDFTIRGFTTWDWYKYPRGTFHITVNIKRLERAIFYQSLNQSISIYNAIIEKCLFDNHISPKVGMHQDYSSSIDSSPRITG